MKKLFKTLIISTFVVAVGLSFSSAASAVTLEFQAFSHPGGGRSVDRNALDSLDYGLVLNGHTFHFLDVIVNVDTTTGQTTINNGLVRHIATGDLWNINVATGAGTIGSLGTFNSGVPVPYDNMFEDLLTFGIANGYTGYSNSITYENNTLSLTPLGPVSAGGFTGPLDWIGKAFSGHEWYTSYRHRITHANFSGAEWNALVTAAWWIPQNPALSGSGDFLYTQHHVVIPETSTFVMFGVGFLILLVYSKRGLLFSALQKS